MQSALLQMLAPRWSLIKQIKSGRRKGIYCHIIETTVTCALREMKNIASISCDKVRSNDVAFHASCSSLHASSLLKSVCELLGIQNIADISNIRYQGRILKSASFVNLVRSARECLPNEREGSRTMNRIVTVTSVDEFGL